MPDPRREVLAMTPEELAFWGSREEFERQQWAKDRGHCCWAGAVAWPESCPWHPGQEARDV